MKQSIIAVFVLGVSSAAMAIQHNPVNTQYNITYNTNFGNSYINAKNNQSAWNSAPYAVPVKPQSIPAPVPTLIQLTPPKPVLPPQQTPTPLVAPQPVLPLQKTPVVPPKPQSYNVPGKIPALQTHLMYTPSVPPKAIILAPVQPLISRNDPIGVQGDIQKLTITVVDTQTPVGPTTLPAPATAKTSIATAPQRILTINGINGKDGATGKTGPQGVAGKAGRDGITTTITKSIVDKSTLAKVDSTINHVKSLSAQTTAQAKDLKAAQQVFAQTQANTHSQFKNLKDEVDGNKKEARGGVASAVAIASMPQVEKDQAVMFSAGAGEFRGEEAVSVGASFHAGRAVVKAGMSDSTNNDFAMGVGVGIGF
ncbi:YadA C-terminal domain-containing protein [Enterobacter sichuanensis]|uniref:YadA C-terminal domain-containing protein n=1 Tax=Enterobacter sichuanensis TaxID=2071710 RepID=UPI00281489AA|nr:YadA-like family protein [Enterobacter sichuanensis]MDR0174583.1 YadA-like family protein [Enterobacter sichuanensis]